MSKVLTQTQCEVVYEPVGAIKAMARDLTSILSTNNAHYDTVEYYYNQMSFEMEELRKRLSTIKELQQ